MRNLCFQSLYVIITVVFLILLVTAAIIAMKWHQRSKPSIVRLSILELLDWLLSFLAVAAKLNKESTRFRKRDKALFYGRKMLRKVRSISGEVRNTGQGRKRKIVMRFARKILQLKKENEAEQLKVKCQSVYINKWFNFKL